MTLVLVKASSIPRSKGNWCTPKTLVNKTLRSNAHPWAAPAVLDCRGNAAKVWQKVAATVPACSNSAIPFQTRDKTLRCHSDLEANTSGCRKLTKLEPLESPHAHCGLGVDVWHLRPHQKISADEGRFDGLSSKSRNDAQRQRHTEARLS